MEDGRQGVYWPEEFKEGFLVTFFQPLKKRIRDGEEGVIDRANMYHA
jgi:hypothetical protein